MRPLGGAEGGGDEGLHLLGGLRHEGDRRVPVGLTGKHPEGFLDHSARGAVLTQPLGPAHQGGQLVRRRVGEGGAGEAQGLLDLSRGPGPGRRRRTQEQIGDQVGAADQQLRYGGAAHGRPVGRRGHGGLDHGLQLHHPGRAELLQPLVGGLGLLLLAQEIRLCAGLGPACGEVQLGGIAAIVADDLGDLRFAGRRGLAALGGLHRPERFRQPPQAGQHAGGIDPIACVDTGRDVEHLARLGEAADRHKRRRHLAEALVVERTRSVQDGADADHCLGVAARPGDLGLGLQRPIGLLAVGPR